MPGLARTGHLDVGHDGDLPGRRDANGLEHEGHHVDACFQVILDHDVAAIHVGPAHPHREFDSVLADFDRYGG